MIRSLTAIAIMLPLACSKPGGESAPANSSTAPLSAIPGSAASGARRPDRLRGRHVEGMVGLLLGEAHELTLKGEQKAALDRIEQQLRGDAQGPPAAIKELHSTIVAGVRAGKLDAAKLTALRAEIDKAMQARKDKESDAVNSLYASLEPGQRKALVNAVRTRQTEREARFATRKVDAPKPDPSAGAKHKLDRMTKELDLDAAQQKKVEAALAKDTHQTPASLDAAQEEMKKRLDALLTAFEGEGFDARKLEVSPMAGKMTEMLDQQAQFLTQLLPILKPEQREKMAANMDVAPGRRGPPGSPHGEPRFDPFVDDPRGPAGPPMPPR